MSYLDARTQYRRAEDGVLPDLANPHEIILITLRELHRSLLVLSLAQADGARLPNTHVTRSMTAVYILQSSLDFEKGGEIATNLFRVYEFVRLQLVAAFQREPDAKLDAAKTYIADIMDAWQKMPQRG